MKTISKDISPGLGGRFIKPLGRLVPLAVLFAMVGIMACSAAKKPRLDPESQKFYRCAGPLFTKHEARIFKHLVTREERETFIENFWALRDPDPDTEENEFKIEIEQRYRFVVKYLREGHLPGWKTDRGRIYLVLGPPTLIDSETMLTEPGLKGYIHWYYGDNVGTRLFIRFVDYKGFGEYRLDPMTTSLELLSALENMKYQVLNKDGNIFDQVRLKFVPTYDAPAGEFKISLRPRHVTFEKKGNKLWVRFKVHLVIYRKDNTFIRYGEVLDLELDADRIAAKGSRIDFSVSYPLGPGKYKVDVLITDLMGERTGRHFFTVNVTP